MEMYVLNIEIYDISNKKNYTICVKLYDSVDKFFIYESFF